MDKGGHWGMTKRNLKKTFSTIIAMAAILVTLIALRPVRFGGAVGTLGDEDVGNNVLSVVEYEECL